MDRNYFIHYCVRFSYESIKLYRDEAEEYREHRIWQIHLSSNAGFNSARLINNAVYTDIGIHFVFYTGVVFQPVAMSGMIIFFTTFFTAQVLFMSYSAVLTFLTFISRLQLIEE